MNTSHQLTADNPYKDLAGVLGTLLCQIDNVGALDRTFFDDEDRVDELACAAEAARGAMKDAEEADLDERALRALADQPFLLLSIGTLGRELRSWRHARKPMSRLRATDAFGRLFDRRGELVRLIEALSGDHVRGGAGEAEGHAREPATATESSGHDASEVAPEGPNEHGGETPCGPLPDGPSAPPNTSEVDGDFPIAIQMTCTRAERDRFVEECEVIYGLKASLLTGANAPDCAVVMARDPDAQPHNPFCQLLRLVSDLLLWHSRDHRDPAQRFALEVVWDEVECRARRLAAAARVPFAEYDAVLLEGRRLFEAACRPGDEESRSALHTFLFDRSDRLGDLADATHQAFKGLHPPASGAESNGVPPPTEPAPTKAPADREKPPARKGKDINARMLSAFHAQPESREWSARQWAAYLGCSASTVVGTPAWTHFETLKELGRLAAAERMAPQNGSGGGRKWAKKRT